ncbi:MAG: DUF3769 domain-containing protein [Oscillatoriales cyanobacterium SM2_2_1]|nr:DUF3769 domain-containing protein [Oscillatoriales cyanobacterium SM2_2_1]
MSLPVVPPPPIPVVREVRAADTVRVMAHVQQALETFPIEQLAGFGGERLTQLGPPKPEQLPLPKPSDPLPELPPLPAVEESEKVTITGDRQTYDTRTQVFTVVGNVTVRFRGSQLQSDQVTLNLATQETIAEGNVFFVRGDQQLRGDRLTYNYRTVKGMVTQARGSLNLGTLNRTEASRLPADTAPSSLVVSVLGSQGNTGEVRRLGFTADTLTLDGEVWTATNLRVTNDPFSPPELELVTARATLKPVAPGQDRLEAESPTLVFDRQFSLPVPVNSILIDRFQRQVPTLLGFDRADRGGLFYQQSFDVVTEPSLSFQLSPQLLLQRAFEGQRGSLNFDVIGLVATLDGNFGDRQNLSVRANLSGLDFSRLDSQLRFNASYQLPIGDLDLVTQYAFRDRIFNGSLGFQDVNNSISATLLSPSRALGDTGIFLNFQAGVQLINAERGDLTPSTLGTLGRVQGAAVLSRGFLLLRGEPLAPERDTGLKYSPQPITPGLEAYVSLSGAYSYYTNGANQGAIAGTVGLVGTIGNFARDALDFTSFNIAYTQTLVSGLSPFFIDRIADTQTLTASLLQQIYGPVRFGIQQSWNLTTGQLFDSVYTLQYDRRTYAVIVRYNPNQGIGELLFRLSDFNWTGTPSPVTRVQGGVERQE